jgi:hypothetical protein
MRQGLSSVQPQKRHTPPRSFRFEAIGNEHTASPPALRWIQPTGPFYTCFATRVMSARKPKPKRVSRKASNFENLAYDLAPGLVALEKEGKIKFPCDVVLSGVDDELLGSFEVDGNGRFSVASEDRRIVDAVFPLTVIITDSRGHHLEITWSPPAVQ